MRLPFPSLHLLQVTLNRCKAMSRALHEACNPHSDIRLSAASILKKRPHGSQSPKERSGRSEGHSPGGAARRGPELGPGMKVAEEPIPAPRWAFAPGGPFCTKSCRCRLALRSKARVFCKYSSPGTRISVSNWKDCCLQNFSGFDLKEV